MKFYSINQYVKGLELRVVDAEGKQIGVMSKQAALDLGRERGVDLVEIAPMAKPPVAKLIDFKKFKYMEAKKEREGRVKSGKVELKEIRFTPFIAAGDYNSRIAKIREYFEDGDRVKIVVKFTGRQITRVDFGKDLIARIVSDLREDASADGEPKLQGKQLFVLLNPAKKSRQKNETENT